jgi:hypothetical protein
MARQFFVGGNFKVSSSLAWPMRGTRKYAAREDAQADVHLSLSSSLFPLDLALLLMVDRDADEPCGMYASPVVGKASEAKDVLLNSSLLSSVLPPFLVGDCYRLPRTPRLSSRTSSRLTLTPRPVSSSVQRSSSWFLAVGGNGPRSAG